MKNKIINLVIAIVIVVVLAFTVEIQTVDEYYKVNLDKIKEDSPVVYLTIDVSNILKHYNKLGSELQDEKYVPSSGFILKKTPFAMVEGDTAFKLLERVIKFYKIEMTTETGFGLTGSYVTSINHIYEFSCGGQSGWLYKVNEKYQNTASSQCVLSPNDEVVFYFTCEFVPI